MKHIRPPVIQPTMQTKPEPNAPYASLPKITRVVLKHSKKPDRVLTVTGADAQKLADLWRSLPKGSGARCFDPAFDFEFRDGEKVVRRATVCWRCSQSKFEGEKLLMPFNSRSTEAQALLALCQRLLPLTKA